MTTPPTDARDGAQVPQEDAMTSHDAVMEHIDNLLEEYGNACAMSALSDATTETYHAEGMKRKAVNDAVLAALATPPAPDRTLAELVDAYRTSVIAVIARMDSCHPSQGETPEFIWFKQAVDEEANAKRALLAYQSPAPVSRADAVEISDAMVEAALNEKYDDGSTVNMGGKRHIPLSQMSFSETSRMRRILTAALAAAEGTS